MQYVRVKAAPTELRKDEFAIHAPTFLSEVQFCDKKRPRNGVASLNYLRELVARVGAVYMPETFDPLTSVNISNFKGTPCTSDEEANATLLKLFTQQFPKMLDAYVEHHLKQRPNGTRTIYYLGGGAQASIFMKLGLEEVLAKDLYKDEKPKKIVGKPAVTNEEALKKSETVV